MSTITIQCGSVNHHHGRTRFTINTQGQISITNKYLDRVQEFSDRADFADVTKLVEEIKSNPPASAIETRKGVAGEAMYQIDISPGIAKMDKALQITVWQNDLKKYPAVKALVDYASKCVNKCSYGKVLL